MNQVKVVVSGIIWNGFQPYSGQTAQKTIQDGSNAEGNGEQLRKLQRSSMVIQLSITFMSCNILCLVKYLPIMV